MALSEEEQRLLAQMEAALAADDPKLASTLRGSNRGRLRRRRAALAAVGFFLGLALLVLGMQSHWSVSIAGFVLMFVSAIFAIGSWQAAPPASDAPTRSERFDVGSRSRSRAGVRFDKAQDKNFMDKMEERWRRRQDEGL